MCLPAWRALGTPVGLPLKGTPALQCYKQYWRPSNPITGAPRAYCRRVVKRQTDREKIDRQTDRYITRYYRGKNAGLEWVLVRGGVELEGYCGQSYMAFTDLYTGLCFFGVTTWIWSFVAWNLLTGRRMELILWELSRWVGVTEKAKNNDIINNNDIIISIISIILVVRKADSINRRNGALCCGKRATLAGDVGLLFLSKAVRSRGLARPARGGQWIPPRDSTPPCLVWILNFNFSLPPAHPHFVLLLSLFPLSLFVSFLTKQYFDTLLLCLSRCSSFPVCRAGTMHLYISGGLFAQSSPLALKLCICNW